VAVLPHNREARSAILKSGILNDADARVRLAALLALAELPADAQAGEAIARVLGEPQNADDHWLLDAVTCAAAAHDLPFLKTVAEGRFGNEPGPLAVVARVAEHYARGGPVSSVGSLVTTLANADGPLAEAVVGGLTRGWPKNRPAQLHAAEEMAISGLLSRLSPAAQGQLLRLSIAWGSKSFESRATAIVQSLLAQVSDGKQSDPLRVTAARQLVEFRPEDESIVGKLLEMVTPAASPQLAEGLLDALTGSRAASVGPDAIARLSGWTPSARSAALRLLLARLDTARALLDGIEKGAVRVGDLTADQKHSLVEFPDRRLAARARRLLARGGAMPDPDRQKVVEQFRPLVRQTGDAERGKAVFKTHCAKCHTHGGEGGKVGPDLTGMAVHPKDHLLIDILDPSRSVEGNYRLYTVATREGRVLNGLLASETKTAVEVLDAEGKRHVILREDLEQLIASPKSLMPDGFEKQMSVNDLANLLEFLTQRDRYLPLPLGKAATVVSTRGMFYSEDATIERLIFDDWSPKTVAGVPFHLVDPQGERVPNAILLFGPQGKLPPRMPRSVSLPCNASARAIHLLGGVSGWGYPLGEKGSVSLIVRLHYQDGTTEDHPLKNGVHLADYIRRVDVPESQFAFLLHGRQLRHVTVKPRRLDPIHEIELVKGVDDTAPVIMAVTVELPR
jgi:putative heme-binding domain-containing protein